VVRTYRLPGRNLPSGLLRTRRHLVARRLQFARPRTRPPPPAVLVALRVRRRAKLSLDSTMPLTDNPFLTKKNLRPEKILVHFS
jgi:hypothetical protein